MITKIILFFVLVFVGLPLMAPKQAENNRCNHKFNNFPLTKAAVKRACSKRNKVIRPGSPRGEHK